MLSKITSCTIPTKTSSQTKLLDRIACMEDFFNYTEMSIAPMNRPFHIVGFLHPSVAPIIGLLSEGSICHKNVDTSMVTNEEILS